VEYLKRLEIDSEVSHEYINSLQSKKSTLKKLYVTRKVAADERIDVKVLYDDIKKVYDKEMLPTQKDLVEPDHLICMIGGFIMDDPVTLESGRTFDRSQIEMLFDYVTIAIEKGETDPETGQVTDENGTPINYYCPMNLVSVDPEIMIPNRNLKEEIDQFYEKNPWSFEYDPRKIFKNIVIWEDDCEIWGEKETEGNHVFPTVMEMEKIKRKLSYN